MTVNIGLMWYIYESKAEYLDETEIEEVKNYSCVTDIGTSVSSVFNLSLYIV